MSKIKQPKIPVLVDEEGILSMAVEQGVIENEFNWELVRERDGLAVKSKGVRWIEWDERGAFKEHFQKVKVGRSLIMSPFNSFFTWQTTTVTDIIEERFDWYVKFKTGNSTYVLSKIHNEAVGNLV